MKSQAEKLIILARVVQCFRLMGGALPLAINMQRALNLTEAQRYIIDVEVARIGFIVFSMFLSSLVYVSIYRSICHSLCL